MNIIKIKKKAQLDDLNDDVWLKREVDILVKPDKVGEKPERYKGILLIKKGQEKTNENN